MWLGAQSHLLVQVLLANVTTPTQGISNPSWHVQRMILISKFDYCHGIALNSLTSCDEIPLPRLLKINNTQKWQDNDDSRLIFPKVSHIPNIQTCVHRLQLCLPFSVSPILTAVMNSRGFCTRINFLTSLSGMCCHKMLRYLTTSLSS